MTERDDDTAQKAYLPSLHDGDRTRWCGGAPALLGYDTSGYARDVYDRSGFNWQHVHKDTGTPYNPEGYDYEGYDHKKRDHDGKHRPPRRIWN